MRSTRPISLILVIIGGFRQERHSMHGMARLHERLAARHFDRRDSFVAMEDWRTDARVLGDKIAHAHARAHRRAKIVIVSYSWGNPTARRLIARLREHAITAHQWWMLDPVVRWSQAWFSPRNLIALTTWGRFIRPDNVESVRLYRQLNNRPQGRRVIGLVSEDRQTVFGAASTLSSGGEVGRLIADPSVTHDTLDELQSIHDEIAEAIDGHFPPGSAPGNGTEQP